MLPRRGQSLKSGSARGTGSARTSSRRERVRLPFPSILYLVLPRFKDLAKLTIVLSSPPPPPLLLAVAFAQIDWQDFVLVETIDFTSADQALALPGPTSVRELEARTLTEKRMSSLIMEEAAPAVEDESFAVELAPVVEETEQDVERRRKEEEAERAREIQRKYAESQGTMKIRKDYVPKCESSLPSPSPPPDVQFSI